MKRFRAIAVCIIALFGLNTQLSGQVLTNKGQTITITNGARMTLVGDAVNEGTLRNEGTLSVSGDWTNSSSYLSDAGTFILNSSSVQQVNHGGDTFYILELDGGGRKVFTSDIEIINSLMLISGVAEVPSDRTFLLREGVSVTGGSDASFIEGIVYAAGTGDLIFPIGVGGTYAPVELLDVTGTSPVTGMEVLAPNPSPNAGFGVSDVSALRYWERTQLSGDFEEAIVKISMRDETIISGSGQAVVAITDAVGGDFTSAGQSAATGNPADGTVTSSDRVDATIFALGRELNEGRLADSLALVSLLNNNPGSWTNDVNWADAGITMDTWTNITLDAQGRVASLVITDGGMTGELTPDLRVMTALETLNLSNNQLTGEIPSQFIQLTALETLNLSDNEIETLPDLTGLTQLTSFDVRNNRIQFASLEINNLAVMDYSPQKPILNTGGDIRLDVGQNFDVILPDDSPNNRYEWFLEGVPVAQTTSPVLNVLDLNFDNMGRYYAQVSNTVVPGLILQSDSVILLAEASISGTIRASADEVLEAGTMILLKVNDGAYDTISSEPLLSTGFYEFKDTLANYVIVVDPFDRDAYIPTYYERTIQWDGADVIELRKDTTMFDILVEIKPEETDPEDGNAAVNGSVFTDFPDDTGGRIEARRKVRRVGVALRRRRSTGRVEDDDFDLFAYTQTDDDGNFKFENLPVGTYRIFIEYPGIPIDEDAFTEFTLGEELDENSITLEAVVFEDGIEIDKVEEVGVPYDYLNELSVYPNPTSGDMFITISARKAYEIELELIDLRGEVVIRERLNSQNLGNGTRRLDVSTLSSGLYLIRVYVPEYQDQLYKVGKLMINGR